MLDMLSQLGIRASQPASKPVQNMSQMTPEQFLQLLITQLQNQDPFDPVKNQDLLQQVSAVRQLQSNLDLSTTLTAQALQQQITSAGALIGKSIEGLNAQADKVTGAVTSVAVVDKNVYLDLDNGQRVALKDVTKVSAASSTTTAATGVK